MSYSKHTSVSGLNDIAQLINNFLGSNGWSLTEISSSPKVFHAWKHNGIENQYYEIGNDGSNSIYIEGIDSTPTPTETSSRVHINCNPTMVSSVQLFGGTTYCYIVVENAKDFFVTGGIGTLSPFRPLSSSNRDGVFVMGCEKDDWSETKLYPGYSSSVNFTLDNRVYQSFNHVRFNNSGTISWGVNGGSIYTSYVSSSTSFQSSQAGISLPLLLGKYGSSSVALPSRNQPIIPLKFVGYDSDSQHIPYGDYPGIGLTLMYQINYGEEISIGSDTWVFFPIPHYNRDHKTSSMPDDQEIGLAIKK